MIIEIVFLPEVEKQTLVVEVNHPVIVENGFVTFVHNDAYMSFNVNTILSISTLDKELEYSLPIVG